MAFERHSAGPSWTGKPVLHSAAPFLEDWFVMNRFKSYLPTSLLTDAVSLLITLVGRADAVTGRNSNAGENTFSKPPVRVALTRGESLGHYQSVLLCATPGAMWSVLAIAHIGPRIPARYGLTLVLSSALAAAIAAWRQWRILRFAKVSTATDAAANYSLVFAAIHRGGWLVRQQTARELLVATVPGFPSSMRSWGEREIVTDWRECSKNAAAWPLGARLGISDA